VVEERVLLLFNNQNALRKNVRPPKEKIMISKTLLNKIERFKLFVYGSVSGMLVCSGEVLVVNTEQRRTR
jgi:hypothetical protein